MTGAGPRRSLAAAALALAALCGCAPRAARPDDERSKAEVEDIRAMMFADQDLEVVLPKLDLPGEGNRAVELLSAGKVDEAARLMTPEAGDAVGIAVVLVDAAIKRRQGNAQGAAVELRALLLDTGVSPPWRLWAAHELRRTGAALDEGVADLLLGVVVEVPGTGRAEAMAVYPNLRMRYIPSHGSVLAYDPQDGRLNDVLAAIGPAAQAAYLKAPLVAEGERPPLEENELRLTFLTPRGPRRVREHVETAGRGEFWPVFERFGVVLQTLVKLSQQAHAAKR